jgi:putative nucleotidyltransferase with HDIG domain
LPENAVTAASVLAICDHTIRREELQTLLSPFGAARIATLDELPFHDCAEASLVVVHVDLASRASVDMLRRTLTAQANPQRKTLFIAEDSYRSDVQARGLGASAIVHKPADINAIANALLRLSYSGAAPPANALGDGMAAAQAALGDLFAAGKQDRPVDLGIVTQAADSIDQAIRSAGVHEWIATVRQHHQGTYQHCLLVAGVNSGFCNALGFRPSDRERMVRGAVLHDVGKSYIPLHILDKPGKLDASERQIVELHPGLGADLLQKFHRGERELIEAAHRHHEYIDGSGYPDGLRGQAISDPVRLLTLCDVYAALIEKRSYREPLTSEVALSIMDGMSEKFDPDLLRAFHGFIAAGAAEG